MVKSVVFLIIATKQASNVLDKIYTLYIRNKSIKIVKRNKCITLIMFQLKEVCIDFWESHNLLSQSRNVYAVILIYKFTPKT